MRLTLVFLAFLASLAVGSETCTVCLLDKGCFKETPSLPLTQAPDCAPNHANAIRICHAQMEQDMVALKQPLDLLIAHICSDPATLQRIQTEYARFVHGNH